jgi:hypothetical protein
METVKAILEGIAGVVAGITALVGAIAALVIAWQKFRRILTHSSTTQQAAREISSAVHTPSEPAAGAQVPPPPVEQYPFLQMLIFRCLILLIVLKLMDWIEWGVFFFRNNAYEVIFGPELPDTAGAWPRIVFQAVLFLYKVLYAFVFVVFAWDIVKELNKQPKLRNDVLTPWRRP